MTSTVDLWFSPGSTYTYLTMSRIDQVEAERDVAFNLRPFYLGRIFNDLGRFPFVEEPQKLAYMWRDIGRRAAKLGLSPTLPPKWPAPEVLRAITIIHVALRESWGRAYVQHSYREWIDNGNPIGEEPNITNSLKAVGQDSGAILEAASDIQVHEDLKAETDIARSLGIFGSPTFAVGDEIFWGDDHMEEAVDYANG